MSYPEPRMPQRPPRDQPPSAARRPGPRGVVWGSLSLFAVLFALLTFQLSASASSAQIGSGHSAATRKGPSAEAAETTSTDAEEPVEAETEALPAEEEFEEPEFEAEAAEAAEIEAAEIEAAEAEIEPVVTSSS
ncbi:MAG: hypothetical protein U0R26_03665 [Solirubrobacterales bacterium]